MVDKIDSVDQVAQNNAEIAGRMAENTGEVRSSMDGIAATTEQNSASAQEASASTEEMSAQVEEVVASSGVLAELATGLGNSVSVFKINEPSVTSFDQVDEDADTTEQIAA